MEDRWDIPLLMGVGLLLTFANRALQKDEKQSDQPARGWWDRIAEKSPRSRYWLYFAVFAPMIVMFVLMMIKSVYQDSSTAALIGLVYVLGYSSGFIAGRC